jgi:hypothetical protein
MQRQSIITTLAVLGTLAFASLVAAKNATVAIPMGEVGEHAGARGEFYVVNVSIPGDIAGKRLDSVFIEFAVDATFLSLEDSVVSPVVGVYPLRQSFSGGVGDAPGHGAEPVFESVVPSARPIHLGENRVLRMDVTDIVKGWMDEPTSNHGLVIGALTGPEVGRVTLRDTVPGSDHAVRVTFFYQNRFGDRISSRE